MQEVLIRTDPTPQQIVNQPLGGIQVPFQMNPYQMPPQGYQTSFDLITYMKSEDDNKKGLRIKKAKDEQSSTQCFLILVLLISLGAAGYIINLDSRGTVQATIQDINSLNDESTSSQLILAILNEEFPTCDHYLLALKYTEYAAMGVAGFAILNIFGVCCGGSMIFVLGQLALAVGAGYCLYMANGDCGSDYSTITGILSNYTTFYFPASQTTNALMLMGTSLIAAAVNSNLVTKSQAVRNAQYSQNIRDQV